MKIEEEIKQKEFVSERQKLSVNIIFTYNWMVAKMQTFFRRYGLTMQQFNALRILRGQYPQPCTLGLVRERMLDKQSDVSRLLDRLVKKGLVVRKTCEGDRRKMDVVINNNGLVLLEQMDQEMNKFESLLENLSDNDVVTLNDLLDKVRA